MIRSLTRLLVVLLVVCSFASAASATHFRFGHTTWTRVSNNQDGSVTVQFVSTQAWRTSGLDILGLSFGDGSSFNPSGADITDIFAGTDLAGEGYTIRQYTVQHIYSQADIASNNGIFVAFGTSCCRISSLINAGDDSERVSTIVDLNGGNIGSPVSGIPVILQMSQGQLNTLAIPFADPDGDAVTCRLATSGESLISSIASAGGNDVAVSAGCILSWDLTATGPGDVGNKYAVQIILEESNRCVPGQQRVGCGSVALDFIIEIVIGNPPVCTSDKPVNGTAYANYPFSVTFTGTDADPGATLTSATLGAPAGAVISPIAGSTQPAPAASTMSWVPTEADRGLVYAGFFTYTDETGLQGVCPFSINVSEGDPDLGCTGTNISETQFRLDGSANQLSKLARRVAGQMRKLGASAKSVRKIREQSVDLYEVAWATTWLNIDSIQLSCTNANLCVASSNSEGLDAYLSSVNGLNDLVNSSLASLKRLGGSTKKFSARAAVALAEANSAVGEVPSSTSSCAEPVPPVNA